jgi:hypothetical protein
MDIGKQTLEGCMTIALNMERSKAELKLLSNPSTTGDNVLALTKKPTSRPRDKPRDKQPAPSHGNRKCYRCGSTGHLANSSQCTAKNVECRKCKKEGHYEKMCLSRGSESSNNVRRSEDSRVRHIGGSLVQLSIGGLVRLVRGECHYRRCVADFPR